MRLATYTRAGRDSYGVVLEGGICDVPALWPEAPRTLLKALQAGTPVMEKIEALAASTKTLLPKEHISLVAPIPAPPDVAAGRVSYHVDPEAEPGDAVPSLAKLLTDIARKQARPTIGRARR
jgi:hypothetical protein